jgi:hypothetical protein
MKFPGLSPSDLDGCTMALKASADLAGEFLAARIALLREVLRQFMHVKAGGALRSRASCRVSVKVWKGKFNVDQMGPERRFLRAIRDFTRHSREGYIVSTMSLET